jgi:1-acyl-sn-glycerol-3-phosphate acyltransferase
VGQAFCLEAADKKIKGAVRQQMADEMMYQLAAMLPEKYRGEYADLSQATTVYLNFNDVN